MQINWDLVVRIAVPLATTILGAWISRALVQRPRLVAFYLHASSTHVTQVANPFVVNSHAVVLRNTGKKSATNVRVLHNVFPNFSIHPAVPHTVNNIPGGSVEVLIPVIVPGEQITLSYLYLPPVTVNQVNAGIRYDDGFARPLNVVPTPQPPKWVVVILLGLILIGTIALVYMLVLATIFLVGLLGG